MVIVGLPKVKAETVMIIGWVGEMIKLVKCLCDFLD